MIKLIPNSNYREEFKKEILQTICDILYTNTYKNEFSTLKCMYFSNFINTTDNNPLVQSFRLKSWTCNLVYKGNWYIDYYYFDTYKRIFKVDYSKPDYYFLSYKCNTINDSFEKEIYNLLKNSDKLYMFNILFE